MAYDNVCKYLVERFPEQFAQWLLGSPISLTQLDPTELSAEPIRADSVILLSALDRILHLEFQTDPDPQLPFRMADYRLRLYRKYPQRQVQQIVVYLRRSTSSWVFETEFRADELSHQFGVLRLWEQDPSSLLALPGLLPFVMLTQSDQDPEVTLQQIAGQLQQIPDPQLKGDLKASTAVLAGLVLSKDVIRQILEEIDMRESVIYQEWRAEALKEGRQEGLQQGIQQGLEQGLEQGVQLGELQLTLRQLERKLGSLSPDLEARIRSLPLGQLENLAVALLDFAAEADLLAWLEDPS
jgi:predicted transposase/invertase (TIGR01784 family)